MWWCVASIIRISLTFGRACSRSTMLKRARHCTRLIAALKMKRIIGSLSILLIGCACVWMITGFLVERTAPIMAIAWWPGLADDNWDDGRDQQQCFSETWRRIQRFIIGSSEIYPRSTRRTRMFFGCASARNLWRKSLIKLWPAARNNSIQLASINIVFNYNLWPKCARIPRFWDGFFYGSHLRCSKS